MSETYPRLAEGDRVILTRYINGSVLKGDHADADFTALGTVVASPPDDMYLSVRTDHPTPDDMRSDDTRHSGTCNIGPDSVTLHVSELWRWTVTPVTHPNPGYDADMDLREKLARTLAYQNSGITDTTMSPQDWWDLILTDSVRERYRKNADEVFLLIHDA